jgi:hydrogenase nickel incorporation protein HypA/HybF
MHEYVATERIVRIVDGTARTHRARRVTAVFLVVGENTCILPDSVQMYFDMIARNTAAEGAKLHVRIVKPEMRCTGCGRRFQRAGLSFACPVCGATGAPTDIGNECYVERAELETDS